MYKLFELKDGKLKTLFHGVPTAPGQQPRPASRIVPIGTWIEAVQKPVTDGSGSPKYLSGFHVFCCDLEDISKYCDRFRKERELVLVDVCVSGVRLKPTNKQVLLAARMYIPEEFESISIKNIREISYVV